MLHDWHKIYTKLKRKRFAHDDQRILFVRTEAATPQERVEMNDNCLRLTGCWGWENRRRFYQLRRKLNNPELPGLWKLRLTNAEMIWLPDMDLNHDKQIQSLLCYRYTIGQAGACRSVCLFQCPSSRQTGGGHRKS